MEISQLNLYKLLKLKTLKNKIEHFEVLKGHADLNKKNKNNAEMSRFLLLLVQAITGGNTLSYKDYYYFHDPVGTVVTTSANASDEELLAKSRYHNNQNVWNEFYRIVNDGSVLAKKNLKTQMIRQLEQDSLSEYTDNTTVTLKKWRDISKREAQDEEGRSGDGYNISNWMNFLELEFALAIYKIEEDLKEDHVKVGNPKIYTYKDIAKIRVNHFFKYKSPKTGIGGFARGLLNKMPKVYGTDQTSKNTQKLLDYLVKRKDELNTKVKKTSRPTYNKPRPRTEKKGGQKVMRPRRKWNIPQPKPQPKPVPEPVPEPVQTRPIVVPQSMPEPQQEHQGLPILDEPQPAAQPLRPVEEPEPEPQKPQLLPDILIQPILPLSEAEEKKPLVINGINQSEEPEIQEEKAKINIQTSKTTVEKEKESNEKESNEKESNEEESNEEESNEEELNKEDNQSFIGWIFGWMIFLVFLIIKIGTFIGIMFLIYFFVIKKFLLKKSS